MRRQPKVKGRGLPWSVYLLRCADGSLYCGITNHVERRLLAHARGQIKYTRGRLPVELAYVEPARDRSQALRREAALKRLRRAAKLERIRSAVGESAHLSLSQRSITRKRCRGFVGSA